MTSTSAPAPATAPTGRRAGLDRDDIVAAALALVEADGVSALSMRRLATELGVTTTTIYWHVGVRDALVAAIIERLSDQLAAREPEGRTSRDRVTSAAHHVWDSALSHRQVTSLAHQCGLTSLLQLPLERALARELDAAGLRGEAARDALRAILMCVAGFLVVALRPTDSIPVEQRSQTLWADVVDDHIDPTTIAALAEPPDVTALFEQTIGAVVAHYVPAGRGTTRRNRG